MTNFLSKMRQAVRVVANALMAGEHARDRKLYEQWTELHRKAAADAKLRLIQVREVYQKATTGTKAIVVHRARGLHRTPGSKVCAGTPGSMAAGSRKGASCWCASRAAGGRTTAIRTCSMSAHSMSKVSCHR